MHVNKLDAASELSHSLINWDSLRAQVSGCSSVSGGERADDKRAVASVYSTLEA